MSVSKIQIAPVMIEQVEERLLDAIVDGTLAPGARLTQDGVATLFGISRQPVSHALQALKRRGLVVEHGKRGLAVAPLDAQRIRDLYQVRAALDGSTAELAAGHVRAGTAQRRDLEAARNALRQGAAAEARREGDLRILIDHDVGFHLALQALSGNAAIGEVMAAHWPHFKRSMRVVFDDAAEPARVWREHTAILDAVLAGDTATAAELARAHATRAGERTATRWEAQIQRAS